MIHTLDMIDHCGFHINDEPHAFDDEGGWLAGIDVKRVIKKGASLIFVVEDELDETGVFYTDDVRRGPYADKGGKIEDCPKWVSDAITADNVDRARKNASSFFASVWGIPYRPKTNFSLG